MHRIPKIGALFIYRFLPVKKTSDLLLVMSNLYSLEHGALVMSPKVEKLSPLSLVASDCTFFDLTS